jgi:hypothetical protein
VSLEWICYDIDKQKRQVQRAATSLDCLLKSVKDLANYHTLLKSKISMYKESQMADDK